MSEYSLPFVDPKPAEEARTTTSLKAYYTRLNDWCEAACEEGKALQTNIPELNEISQTLEYLSGLQWKEAMPSYRSKPVSNEFLQMFWETIGLLTDIRPMFHITDCAADGKFSEIEKIVNRGAKAWASTNQFEQRMSFCMMYGMLTSAPAKIYWNPFARGNSGDPEDGDISLEARSPASILRLGNGWSTNIQDDECVIERQDQTLDWIKRAYPNMGKYVQAEDQKSSFTTQVSSVQVQPQLYPPMSSSARMLKGVGDKNSYQSVYPKAEVQTFWYNDDLINESREKVWMGPKNASWGYWVNPGKKLYPRGHVVVRANRVILYDQPNPYFHRRKPFAIMSLYGVPWQQYAMSVCAPWMKQQDILNQMMAGILDVVKKTLRPALMAAKSAISPAAMKSIDSGKPNLKITYSQNAPHAPTWQTPPALPTNVLQVYTMILNSMKQSSGASAVGDALGKKQVPSGDSLEKITQAKNTPIRYMGRAAEWFLDDVGQMWTANFLQFYDAGMRMELLGPSGLAASDLDDKPGSLIPDGINSEQFVRRYHFKTKKGSLLNAQHQEKLPIVFAMRKGRDLSRKKVFEFLAWNINEKENDEELAEEAQAQAKAQAAAGVQPKGGHR